MTLQRLTIESALWGKREMSQSQLAEMLEQNFWGEKPTVIEDPQKHQMILDDNPFIAEKWVNAIFHHMVDSNVSNALSDD